MTVGGDETNMTDYAFFLWDHRHAGSPTVRWV
jgi:hypothetical protein